MTKHILQITRARDSPRKENMTHDVSEGFRQRRNVRRNAGMGEIIVNELEVKCDRTPHSCPYPGMARIHDSFNHAEWGQVMDISSGTRHTV